MTDTTKTPTEYSKRGPIAIFIVAVLIAVGVGYVLTAEDTPDEVDVEFEAFDVCRQFVRDGLKSPSSAVFRNYFEDDGEVQVFGQPSRMTVQSTVDADNSFGASIRSDFTCIVQQQGDKWTLISLTMD